MKCKMAFMHKPHDLRIEEVELPALKPNQLLIKVGACGICGSDVECYEGKSAEGRYDIAPYTPGHEWSGKVIEVGTDVKALKAGMKVTGDCVMACGTCRNCKDGLMPSACLNFREAGFRPDSPGGMGEYMIVEEQYVHQFPDDWSYAMGAWVETFSIGYFGLWGGDGKVDASDTVLIFGCGPIGISTAMVAKTAGAKVIVVEPIASRRELALKYGADYVLDFDLNNLKEKIYQITNNQGPTVIAETSGDDTATASIFDIAGHACRIHLIGHTIGRKIPLEIGWTIWKTLTINGFGGTKDFGQRTIRFMSAIKDKYDFDALNTHYFSLDQIHEAIDVAATKKDSAFKVMLKFPTE